MENDSVMSLVYRGGVNIDYLVVSCSVECVKKFLKTENKIKNGKMKKRKIATRVTLSCIFRGLTRERR